MNFFYTHHDLISQYPFMPNTKVNQCTYTLNLINDVDTVLVDGYEDRKVLMSDEGSQSPHRLLHLPLEES